MRLMVEVEVEVEVEGKGPDQPSLGTYLSI